MIQTLHEGTARPAGRCFLLCDCTSDAMDYYFIFPLLVFAWRIVSIDLQTTISIETVVVSFPVNDICLAIVFVRVDF